MRENLLLNPSCSKMARKSCDHSLDKIERKGQRKVKMKSLGKFDLFLLPMVPRAPLVSSRSRSVTPKLRLPQKINYSSPTLFEDFLTVFERVPTTNDHCKLSE